MDALAFAPTEEQDHVCHLASTTTDNIQIRALAGCAKTTMLKILQAEVLPRPAPPFYEPTVLGLAFNTVIDKKMGEEFLPSTSHRTFNSLGLSVWNTAQGIRCVVEKEGNRVVKTLNEFKRQVEGLSKRAQREAWDIYSDVNRAVGLAKSTGYIPRGRFPNSRGLIEADEFYAGLDERPSSLCIDLVEAILTASIAAAYKGNIDFDDQCYMPVLFGGAWPNFPNILVDERQDLNPVNTEMLAHFKKSRLFTVGDNWQSIYAFRGAVQGGMNLEVERFKMTVAHLSVSFRCRQRIVENARWRAPNFQWIKPGGRVAALKNPSSTTFPDGCAILCRNNAPIFKMALHLLSHGRSVRVSGSDIGPRVVGLMKKLGPEDLPRERLLRKIEDWREERLANGSVACDDTADCMRVFANTGRTLGEAITYASDLLKRDGTIVLSTGHKAKGLEWPIVYHLDPHLCRDDEQDLNLRYVIQTRAEDTYYEIQSAEVRA